MLVCIISILFRILVQSLLPSLRWLFWVESISFLIYISWFFWILFLNFSCFEGLYCVHKVIISSADSVELFCCFQQLFFIFVCFNSWKGLYDPSFMILSCLVQPWFFPFSFLYYTISYDPFFFLIFIFGLVPLGVVYLRVSFYMAPRFLHDSCFFITPGF